MAFHNRRNDYYSDCVRVIPGAPKLSTNNEMVDRRRAAAGCLAAGRGHRARGLVGLSTSILQGGPEACFFGHQDLCFDGPAIWNRCFWNSYQFLPVSISFSRFTAHILTFLRTVVATLKYNDVNTLLLTAPPYVLAVITTFLNSWHAGMSSLPELICFLS